MTGILAQLIALTAYGNEFLKNGNVPADFNSANTTFQFCNKVGFGIIKKTFFFSKPVEKPVAENPVKWFEYLKNSGCRNLRLYFEHSKDQSFAKDHKLAGLVGGGGSWLIESVYNGYSIYWANRWEVTNKDAIDNKIWTVNYLTNLAEQPVSNLQININKIKDDLQQTLTEIAAFAFKHDLQNWGELFDKAKSTLQSSLPEENYYNKDIVPLGNYSLSAKQVLFSAAIAWVFGGMGSWNDLGFENTEDDETYDRLSAQLYSDIIKAVIAVVNTY